MWRRKRRNIIKIKEIIGCVEKKKLMMRNDRVWRGRPLRVTVQRKIKEVMHLDVERTRLKAGTNLKTKRVGKTA